MTHAITLDDYLMGRALNHSLPERTRMNAGETVTRINLLLLAMVADEVPLEVSPRSKSLVSSGWRPSEVNSTTPGAAPKSKHITGEACDLYDPEGLIDSWCEDNESVLVQIGLWREHSAATKGWAHFQTVPPRSGRRVFYP